MYRILIRINWNINARHSKEGFQWHWNTCMSWRLKSPSTQLAYSGQQQGKFKRKLHITVLYPPVTAAHYWLMVRVTDGFPHHHSDVMMGAMTSQIASLTIVYSSVYSGTDQRKLQSSASLAFVRGIHWWPVNSPHKRPVTWKMHPFGDVIMQRFSNAESVSMSWQPR